MLIDSKEVPHTKQYGPFSFFFLSILVGVVAGLGAVVFRGLIAFFHNLFFFGKLSVVYDANIHTPVSPWGIFVILVPVVGALVVAFLVKNFAPEAKGHGVPEVMDAIYYNKGIIRPVVAVIKSFASAISIGSGGSIGREGPIIQIGSSFGSTLGQILKIPVWERITLIAAGAGGGIAATFNTPIGGVLFAVEIILHELSVRTLVPIAIATATATYIGRIFFGPHPSFVIPSFETPYFHITKPLVLLSYMGLGLIMGVISAIYIKSIYSFEDFFEKRIRGSYYTRHMIGMFQVGIIMYLLMAITGHYYIEGVGYSTVQDVLSGTLSSLLLLMILFALKLFTTSLTLGSGASGGIFSPALYMGATLGGAYGIIVHQIFPGLAISPPAFAVAGMAGVVGGVTGAALAAIVMIFEMTLDYSVIIPMTITVALSYGIRKILLKESIYTLKLVRRGHYIPEALQANLHQLKRAREVMESQLVAVPASSSLDEFVRIISDKTAISYFLVEDYKKVIGVITKESVLEAFVHNDKTVSVREITKENYITVDEETTLFDVIAKMRYKQAPFALVTSNSGNVSVDNVKGLITKQQIADAIIRSIDMFAYY
jgi:CIC family chloride channel protein